jgi:hypothetical protein
MSIAISVYFLFLIYCITIITFLPYCNYYFSQQQKKKNKHIDIKMILSFSVIQNVTFGRAALINMLIKNYVPVENIDMFYLEIIPNNFLIYNAL